MNFFKSVFSEDLDPPKPESPTLETPSTDDDRTVPDPGPKSGSSWSFGGLIKTLATQSESVIETYRRDLQEFGSGLKKEIEVAQGSIGTVGTAIDELGSSVLKGTAQIIAQGREAILTDGHDSDSSDTNSNTNSQLNSGSKPYSRFESQVRAFQSEPGTYRDEPEDSDDYLKWKLGFVLEDKKEEIEELIGEKNGTIDGIYNRLVSGGVVDHETFWCRYFYKVHKLKQAEDLRASLVKRAISGEEDEDLSWDVDDEEDINNNNNNNNNNKEVAKQENPSSVSKSDDKALETVGEKIEGKTRVVTEEEDLGWDEIEDLSSIDDKKVSEQSVIISSPKRTELRKRLSAAEEEEDEDLSWDIEDEHDDDDRPTKA